MRAVRHTATLAALALLAGCAGVAPAPAAPAAPDLEAIQREAARELDDLHASAAAADEARYFGHFSARGVFLGTDATERWETPAFRAYAHPYFAAGKGWTYQPVRRALGASTDGAVVWFDEQLRNAKLGLVRGSGVLVRENGRLLVVQYNLAVPIPNERMAAVAELIASPPPPAPTPAPLEATYKAAYDQATARAAQDPLEDAANVLLAVVPEAKRHPELDTEFWLHNELTWVRWGQGDLAAALREVDAAGVSLDHGTLPEAKRTALRLHELWDRAYLLVEVAMATPTAQRPAALDVAQRAKAAYDALATTAHDADGMAVLAAFFAVRAGDGKGAATAAKRVDLARDEDLQDLYVIAKALDENGEHAAADAVVARICAGHVYLMKPLLVAQLSREGRRCPVR